tara:strand:+ start:30451 stop:30594 length:144 start_codon:yes stop_codon:yes gene_type:complete
MDEEWLGTIYCLLACVGFSTLYLMLWNFVDKVENLIKEFRDRNNKWK